MYATAGVEGQCDRYQRGAASSHNGSAARWKPRRWHTPRTLGWLPARRRGSGAVEQLLVV
jgi:hypothetical protein